MQEASRGLTEDQRSAIKTDIKVAFGNYSSCECRTTDAQSDGPDVKVFVKRRYSGFSNRPLEKIILALEVQSPGANMSCIAKVGELKVVKEDDTGWKKGTKGHHVSSRMFIGPELRPENGERGVVIYPDAFQFFFNHGTDAPMELESAFAKSIKHRDPSSDSIQRVMTQVFTEAHRCFYQFASDCFFVEDESSESLSQQWADVGSQIEYALRIGNEDKVPVFEIWDSTDFQSLRRNAAWLTGSGRKPESLTRPAYVDPVDYLKWALRKNAIPPMTLGPSHGDLHGRNIIVGVVRSEAEWPAVFDYDKMSSDNLVAMDFAKLETELKCRLLQSFLDSTETRLEARKLLGLSDELELPECVVSPEDHEAARQASRMEVMFAIEQRLQNWSAQLTSRERAESKNAEFSSWIPEESDLGKAMAVIFRIRREASIYLGFERPERKGTWLDELNFALTVYGAVTVKWHGVDDFMQWSLLTAGVAAAQLRQLPWPPDPNCVPDPNDVPTFLHVLPWSDQQWRQGNCEHPIEVLENAIERFPYATALRQQLALTLASSGNGDADERARREVHDLKNLACVFRDFETLSRLGRAFKDKGDHAYETATTGLTLQDIVADKMPAYQEYIAALEYYELAFEISGDYYPAINVATLALLTGDHSKQTEVAQKVLDLCGAMSTNREDRTWILASEGEASLLLGKREVAANFYKNALGSVLENEKGTVQSMYDQLCRLHWALGKDDVEPVIEVLDQTGWLTKLDAGSFGNCGR